MSGARILVADDEPHIVRIVRDKLVNAGYEIISADNGADALEKALSVSPDLILLDVMMPKMNGYDVCRAIRKEKSLAGVPVFLLTAKGQAKDMEEGLESGADRYITKPFSPRALLKEIEEALSKK